MALSRDPLVAGIDLLFRRFDRGELLRKGVRLVLYCKKEISIQR